MTTRYPLKYGELARMLFLSSDSEIGDIGKRQNQNGKKAKDAHEPKALTAGAYTGFLTMKHTLEY